jgi:hypothetical protein
MSDQQTDFRSTSAMSFPNNNNHQTTTIPQGTSGPFSTQGSEETARSRIQNEPDGDKEDDSDPKSNNVIVKTSSYIGYIAAIALLSIVWIALYVQRLRKLFLIQSEHTSSEESSSEQIL